MTKSKRAERVKNVHAEDIKAAIRKTGITLEGLSALLGYSPNVVSITLRRPYPMIEAGIASHLGVTPQSLWPDRYDAEGHPLTFPASKRSRAAARRQRQMSSRA